VSRHVVPPSGGGYSSPRHRVPGGILCLGKVYPLRGYSVPRHGVLPQGGYSMPRHGVPPSGGYSMPRHRVPGGTLCLGMVYSLKGGT